MRAGPLVPPLFFTPPGSLHLTRTPINPTMPKRDAPSSPNPGISRTGVQKPNRRENRPKPPTPSPPRSSPVLTPPPDPLIVRPGLVSLDWLTINALSPEGAKRLPWSMDEPTTWADVGTTPPRLYVVERTDIRTSQFRRVSYLTNDRAEKVATIWSEPHQLGRSANWMQVQFANETLYTNAWVNVWRMFRRLGVEYTGISRVDIACDAIEGAGGDFPKVVQMSVDGLARYYGHCDWLTRTSRKTVIGAEFGTHGSNKFIRAYRKKREMKAKGVKPHIVAAWAEAFGFDAWTAPIEVNRCEVQLKGKEIRRYYAAEESSADALEHLAHQPSRANIFASMAVKMFDFRTIADRARDAVPVCAWDWSLVQQQPEVDPRAEKNLALSEHRIKTSLKAMYTVAYYMSDPSGFEACERLAAASGYADWYAHKRAEWVREMIAIERARDPNTLRTIANLKQYGTE